MNRTQTVKIGNLEDFPAGKGKKVVIDGTPIAVFKINNEVYAIQNRCPHKNLPLHLAGEDRATSPSALKYLKKEGTRGGVDEEELCIYCPWHRLEWDLETGYNPVKDINIVTYDTTINEGEVYIEI